jgi:catechol 2,3-dioxygenase-like lactoylglutathione lyase family enzyme
MRINALDHVNIITADLDASSRFYAEVFGLERRNGPLPLTPENAQWMYDHAGRAVIHVNSLECPRAYDRTVQRGPTGSIHHVALNCSGYEEMTRRLDAFGLSYQTNLVAAIGLRQIFVTDPNDVLFELNFFAD